MEGCVAVCSIEESDDDSIEHENLIIAADISLEPCAAYGDIASARIWLHVCD